MEIVSSDDADADDDDKSFFDRVMVLCHDSFSDSSSDGEDKEEALFVWGDLHKRDVLILLFTLRNPYPYEDIP